MRNFIAVYTRTYSLRHVAEKRLEGKVAHGTIDKFIRGSEPQFTTRQLLRKLYMEEHLRDLPTDPDPDVAALYLLHLLNRMPDAHHRAAYDGMVRCMMHLHIAAGMDVPPWLERVAGLYESDEPLPAQPRKPDPPPPPDPDAGPHEYARKRGPGKR